VNRDDVIAGALDIVAERGHDELSIRGLARELGVSAPALYEYIESRDELLRSLAQHGYDGLRERWERISGTEREWLVESGVAYVAFAVDEPGLFTLMHRFSPGAILGEPGIEHPAASALFDDGIGHIKTAIAAGELRDDDPLDIAMALWAAAHGVASVSLLMPDRRGAEALARRVVEALLDGFRPMP
jgi:AcrR family transcriptional regulator